MISEKSIEDYLRKEVEKLGGKAFKFTSPGNAGVPDRLVLLPSGKIVFVELKAPGKKPRALQIAVMDKIRALGFRVEVIDSKEGIKELLRCYLDLGAISNQP